jgi:hypothetical protein
VTTQDPLRQKALVVPNKAERVYNFHQHTLMALKELIQAAGLKHPRDITAHHIVRRNSDQQVRSLAQLMLPSLIKGALLDDDLKGLPLIYQHHWPRASAHQFHQPFI